MCVRRGCITDIQLLVLPNIRDAIAIRLSFDDSEPLAIPILTGYCVDFGEIDVFLGQREMPNLTCSRGPCWELPSCTSMLNGEWRSGAAVVD